MSRYLRGRAARACPLLTHGIRQGRGSIRGSGYGEGDVEGVQEGGNCSGYASGWQALEKGTEAGFGAGWADYEEFESHVFPTPYEELLQD